MTVNTHRWVPWQVFVVSHPCHVDSCSSNYCSLLSYKSLTDAFTDFQTSRSSESSPPSLPFQCLLHLLHLKLILKSAPHHPLAFQDRNRKHASVFLFIFINSNKRVSYISQTPLKPSMLLHPSCFGSPVGCTPLPS
jgi:hypothetical protein